MVVLAGHRPGEGHGVRRCRRQQGPRHGDLAGAATKVGLGHMQVADPEPPHATRSRRGSQLAALDDSLGRAGGGESRHGAARTCVSAAGTHHHLGRLGGRHSRRQVGRRVVRLPAQEPVTMSTATATTPKPIDDVVGLSVTRTPYERLARVHAGAQPGPQQARQDGEGHQPEEPHCSRGGERPAPPPPSPPRGSKGRWRPFVSARCRVERDRLRADNAATRTTTWPTVKRSCSSAAGSRLMPASMTRSGSR